VRNLFRMLVPAEPAPAERTVLVVDDHRELREFVADVLGGSGYRVLGARSLEAAFLSASRFGGPIDLLIANVDMFEDAGAWLTERIGAKYPDVRVLFTSVHSRETLLAEGTLPQRSVFLEKPFHRDGLHEKVRHILDED
jgi:DNA-binding NtrC family response regulator